MIKLDPRLIDGEIVPGGGTAGEALTRGTGGEAEWNEVVPLDGRSQANVLTVLSGGTLTWLGSLVVVIPNGGLVPGGTPIGALIVELDA